MVVREGLDKTKLLFLFCFFWGGWGGHTNSEESNFYNLSHLYSFYKSVAEKLPNELSQVTNSHSRSAAYLQRPFPFFWPHGLSHFPFQSLTL